MENKSDRVTDSSGERNWFYTKFYLKYYFYILFLKDLNKIWVI